MFLFRFDSQIIIYFKLFWMLDLYKSSSVKLFFHINPVNPINVFRNVRYQRGGGVKMTSPVSLNPIWYGGHDGPPKMFLTTVLKRFGGESWNLVNFNINLWSIKKVIFGSLGYPVLPWQRVCRGILEIFWSYRSIWLHIWKKHPKIFLNTKFHRNQWGEGGGGWELQAFEI